MGPGTDLEVAESHLGVHVTVAADDGLAGEGAEVEREPGVRLTPHVLGQLIKECLTCVPGSHRGLRFRVGEAHSFISFVGRKDGRVFVFS